MIGSLQAMPIDTVPLGVIQGGEGEKAVALTMPVGICDPR
jgi:hypothetical protein